MSPVGVGSVWWSGGGSCGCWRVAWCGKQRCEWWDL